MKMRLFFSTVCFLALLANFSVGWADDTTTASARAYVLGEVQAPGSVSLDEKNLTVFDVVARCGGLTRLADGASIRLIHHLPGLKSQIIIVNITRFLRGPESVSSEFVKASDPAKDISVQPGDVIVVPEKVNY